jgi:predicted ester cyclase
MTDNSGTREEKLRLARLYVDEFVNGRNYGIVDEMMTEDFVYHNPRGADRAGREAFARATEAFYAAFPDWHAELRDVLIDGDLISDRVHITATHTESINGVAPTGERIDDDCSHLWRVQDGRIAEGWLFCTANMLRVMVLAATGK